MINIIVAYANGYVIGKEGKIPWHLPDDLMHFKNITSGHTVVMGRKTFETLGRPLPNRRNVVLTHNKDINLPGVEVVHSKDKVLALGSVFIIGGANVYKQFLEEAERLYITEIACDIDGDTYFPDWDRQSFTLISAQEGVLDEKNTLPHTFYVFARKSTEPLNI